MTQYGDSYTEDVTEEGLRDIFKKVAEKVIEHRGLTKSALQSFINLSQHTYTLHVQYIHTIYKGNGTTRFN